MKRTLQLWALCSVFLLLMLAGTAYAQSDTQGTLVAGQPVSGTLNQSSDVLRFDYVLTDARSVALQALSQNIHPTIRILQGDTVIAEQPNNEGTAVTVLTTFLNAGAYIVEAGAANDATGALIVLVESETPVQVQALSAGIPIHAATDPAAPTLYAFTALGEEAILHIDGDQPDHGVNIRLSDPQSGQDFASLSSTLIGGRLRIPAGAQLYQLAITSSQPGLSDGYTVCLDAVSINACGESSQTTTAPTAEPQVLPPASTPEVSVAPDTGACNVTPNMNGSVNIRQSANVQAQIVGSLPGGQLAKVIGIAPDGSFYNVQYNSLFGWISAAVVTTSGECSTVPVVEPPPAIIPVQMPTSTPIPQQPQPRQPQPNPTQGGPCLITMTGAQLVYTIPVADPSNIYDQVGQGYQLIPTGRLGDNSWWHTNYGGAWIETSVFGSTATVSGDCSSLPIVSAP